MLSILASAILLQTPEEGKLFVPVFTAYSNSKKAPLTKEGVDFQKDQYKVELTWIGRLSKGQLELRLPEVKGGFDWTIGDIRVKSKPVAKVRIAKEGYYKIVVNPAKGVNQWCFSSPGLVKSLELSGTATIGAKFNLKERRNAPSVHLKYPLQPEEKVEWFYNEIRPQTDNPATYYQACGFHRGYFGIQVNSPTERRIIFSVWDSGDVPDDRAKVKKEDLVQCLEKGKDVVAEGFGNEGTGGHSHLVNNWKTKDVHRFLVHAQPDGDKTIYTGYYWFNETKKWGLIAKFRAPKDGSYMKGLYSFNENFWGDNGDQLFAARFGPGWVRRPDGSWRDLTSATFSCDKTGREDRFDYSAGTKDGVFFLTNGGAVANGVKYGDPLVRPASKLGPPKVLPTEQ
jgi:hypothetical protein